MTYKAEIKVGGRTAKAEGDSVRDVISKLKMPNTKQKGILRIEHGGKEKELVMAIIMVSRLFSPSPTTREVAIKQTAMRFDF